MDLTHTATFAKRGIIISIVLIILSIAGYTGYRAYISYKIANTPPPEEKANLEYGTLPTPIFPLTLAPSDTYNYTLGTETGGLPKVPNTIRVYFMPRPVATLLAGERSSNLAAKFNVINTPQVLTETKYLYNQDGRNITIEIDSGNFTYANSLIEGTSQSATDDDNRLISDFQSTLSSMGLFREGLRDGRSKLQLLSIDSSGNGIAVSSRSEANGAQISLWPSPIDEKPIVTPQFNTGLISGQVRSSARSIKDYTRLDYTFWNIDTTSFAVYPLKKADNAYEELKNGEGIVVLKPFGTNDVPISSVYLAYYQPKTYTPYLQPIFVFEGPGFAAYISAIGNESVNPEP